MEQLPAELVLALSAAVGFLVAEGLQSLSKLIGRDLSGQAAGITAAVVALLVSVANGLLGQVPAEYAVWVKVVLGALVILFGPAGVHSVLKRTKKPEPQG